MTSTDDELRVSRGDRPLGQSGLTVPAMAWGMWRFAGDDVKLARARADAALETGLRLFDTADIYGPDNGEPFGAAEALFGRILAEDRGLRDRIVLASKVGIRMGVPYDSSAGYIATAVEASLARLRTDRLDLLQIHRPDTLAHPEEVAQALERLRAAGKIRAYGVSNYQPSQVEALMRFLPQPLACNQIELSPLTIAPLYDGSLDLAMAEGFAVLAWSPLGGGRLGSNPSGERARAVAAALDAVAARTGVHRSAVALAWIMLHPARPIPIVGSQDPGRIRESRHAFEVRMSRADWYQILTAARGEPLP